MKKLFYSFMILTLVSISACNLDFSTKPTLTPVDIGAIKTSVVQTVVAGVSQTVAAQVTKPTSTPPVTNTQTSTPNVSDTPSPLGTPTGIICDSMQFVSDSSVPDGTIIAAGQNFVKTWKVKNTGTCTWNQGYYLLFDYGDKLDGQTTALTGDVLPNNQADISVILTAPSKPGTYTGYWRIVNNNNFPFGTILTVIITVK